MGSLTRLACRPLCLVLSAIYASLWLLLLFSVHFFLELIFLITDNITMVFMIFSDPEAENITRASPMSPKTQCLIHLLSYPPTSPTNPPRPLSHSPPLSLSTLNREPPSPQAQHPGPPQLIPELLGGLAAEGSYCCHASSPSVLHGSHLRLHVSPGPQGQLYSSSLFCRWGSDFLFSGGREELGTVF